MSDEHNASAGKQRDVETECASHAAICTPRRASQTRIDETIVQSAAMPVCQTETPREANGRRRKVVVQIRIGGKPRLRDKVKAGDTSHRPVYYAIDCWKGLAGMWWR